MLDGVSRLVIQCNPFDVFPEIPNSCRRSPRSSVGVDIPSVSATSALRTTWVDLWLVADYSGKVLTLKLDFVMAMDDVKSFFLALKATSYIESSSTVVAASGVIGCCSTISKMPCISELIRWLLAVNILTCLVRY